MVKVTNSSRGEQILPGRDHISIALLSYQACVSQSWTLQQPSSGGRTKFSAAESALGALLNTVGQLEPNFLQMCE